MKILDRYVAKSFLIGYVIAFCVLVGLRIIIDLFVNIYIGSTNLTYRSHPWMTARFRDGRLAVSSSEEDGDIPIMADHLHFRNMGFYNGWSHGGGKPDGLWNSSCNTLLNDGSIIHTEANQFDWNSPAIVVSTVDKFWCAIAE